MFTTGPEVPLVFICWASAVLIFRVYLGMQCKKAGLPALNGWFFLALAFGTLFSFMSGEVQYREYLAMFYSSCFLSLGYIELKKQHSFYRSRFVVAATGPLIVFTIFLIDV